MEPARDRRRTPRFAQDEVVRVTPLSEGCDAQDARILDASVGGVRLDIPTPLPLRSLVKVEWQDTLLLGEVLYCQSDRGTNIVGIQLTRALYGMAELRRLNASLIGSGIGKELPRAALPDGGHHGVPEVPLNAGRER